MELEGRGWRERERDILKAVEICQMHTINDVDDDDDSITGMGYEQSC